MPSLQLSRRSDGPSAQSKSLNPTSKVQLHVHAVIATTETFGLYLPVPVLFSECFFFV